MFTAFASRRRSSIACCLLVLTLASLPACRTPVPDELASPDGQHGFCRVCAHEGDLACLRVRIDADTPRCEYRGQTYYFCSEECREHFLARPELYALAR